MDDNKVVEGSFDNSLSYEDLTFSAGYYYSKKQTMNLIQEMI